MNDGIVIGYVIASAAACLYIFFRWTFRSQQIVRTTTPLMKVAFGILSLIGFCIAAKLLGFIH